MQRSATRLADDRRSRRVAGRCARDGHTLARVHTRSAASAPTPRRSRPVRRTPPSTRRRRIDRPSMVWALDRPATPPGRPGCRPPPEPRAENRTDCRRRCSSPLRRRPARLR
jgi:hypothetical protein